MKEISVTSKVYIYESIEELSSADQNLIKKAIDARKNAYAPYSKFKVGSAVLLDNGEIVIGSNQENAAYPSGLCAERVAIYHAGAVYPEAKILKIIITGSSDKNATTTPVPPCGACRQSIAEYETRQNSSIEIYFMGESGQIYHSLSLKNLLPFMFDEKLL